MNDLKSIIYNCKRATFLMEKRELTKLNFEESIELNIHLIRCDVCKLYIMQSKKMNELIKHFFKGNVKRDIRLDDRFKNTWQAQIETEINKN